MNPKRLQQLKAIKTQNHIREKMVWILKKNKKQKNATDKVEFFFFFLFCFQQRLQTNCYTLFVGKQE